MAMSFENVHIFILKSLAMYTHVYTHIYVVYDINYTGSLLVVILSRLISYIVQCFSISKII